MFRGLNDFLNRRMHYVAKI